MVMNSPRPGRSGTEKVTSRITVTLPNRLVTRSKSTTFGTSVDATSDSPTSVLDAAVGKQAALEPEQCPIDAEGEQTDDHQNQDDVLRQPAALAGHQQIAQPVLGVDQLGEHDVAEGQSKQMPQA